jgi:predicted esterase
MLHEHHLTVSRTARYWVLGDPGPATAEVWIVCHGYGQLAERFLARFAGLDDGGRVLVAPEALSRFYLDPLGEHRKVGASWMTREDRLSEIADYLRFLDLVHEAVFERVERERVSLTLLGFSQGTATAARWAVRGAARVDRLVLWSGLLPPDVVPAQEAERLAGLDLVLVAGDRDELAAGESFATQRAALDAAGVRHRLLGFAGGHHLDDEALRRLAQR